MREKQSNRIYMNIAFGRVREKCSKDHAEAVERTTKGGDKTYAIEYKNTGGVLDEVVFRDDEKYGKQWILHLNDVGEWYALQLKEDSRFGVEFLKKLPNMRKGEYYVFTPYDFEKGGDRKVGLKIATRENKRVENYYEKYTDLGDGKWKVEQLHGYPRYVKADGTDGDWKDRDELKIYFMRSGKFLREKAFAFIQSPAFLGTAKPVEAPEAEIERPSPVLEDDLPF